MHICIVGGGIAGLCLAGLLETAGISYQILERQESDHTSTQLAHTLSSYVVHLLDRMGLLEEVQAISKPMHSMEFWDKAGQPLGHIDWSHVAARLKYDGIVVSARSFRELLRSKVDPAKILHGKEVEIIHQNAEEALVICADGTRYYADIVVGADGWTSQVRQIMYRKYGQSHHDHNLPLSEPRTLPEVDTRPDRSDKCVLVGVTNELDPEEFSALADETVKCQVILAANAPSSLVWFHLAIPHLNKFAWVVHLAVPEPTHHPMSIQRPDLEEFLCSLARDLPSPEGGTLARLIDETPVENLERAYNTERMYKTWFDGRIVLMGDAIHQVIPYGGQGAIQCLLDGYSLMRSLEYMLQQQQQQRGGGVGVGSSSTSGSGRESSDGISSNGTVTTHALKGAFKRYVKERYSIAKEAVDGSRQFADAVGREGFERTLGSGIRFDHIPRWLQEQAEAHHTYP